MVMSKVDASVYEPEMTRPIPQFAKVHSSDLKHLGAFACTRSDHFASGSGAKLEQVEHSRDPEPRQLKVRQVGLPGSVIWL